MYDHNSLLSAAVMSGGFCFFLMLVCQAPWRMVAVTIPVVQLPQRSEPGGFAVTEAAGGAPMF